MFVERVVSLPDGTKRSDRDGVRFGRFVIGWWKGGVCVRCDVDL